MFEPNDKVIYPGHGVANVDGVIEKNVAGSSVKFIKLSFIYKDMTILVPVYNADSIGLRYISSESIIEQALKELGKEPEKKFEGIDFTPSGWNRRNKGYQLKIQGGNLLEIVKIYRDLMHVSQQKELSFGERMLLQSIEDLLAQEIQSGKNLGREEVIQVLRCPFKQLLSVASYSKLHVKNGVQAA
jgi:CarD family transcriptional regulator